MNILKILKIILKYSDEVWNYKMFDFKWNKNWSNWFQYNQNMKD